MSSELLSITGVDGLSCDNIIPTTEGIVKISDFKPGMKLANKDYFCTTDEVISEPYYGILYEFHSSKLENPVRVVPLQYLFIVQLNSCNFDISKRCDPECKHIDVCNYPFKCTKLPYRKEAATFISEGDFLIIPKPVAKRFHFVDSDLFVKVDEVKITEYDGRIFVLPIDFCAPVLITGR